MQANTKLAKRADAPCLPSPGLQYTTGGKMFRIICGADNNVNSFHNTASVSSETKGTTATTSVAISNPISSTTPAGSATNTQEQNPSEIKENDPSPPDSDRPEFTFVQDDQQQDQPDHNQQQTTQQGQNQQTSSQQAQNPQSTDAPKQENNQQGQGDGPSEITENGPSPESDDRPEFTFVQDDQQQSQPDQNQQQTTTTQQGQNQQSTDAPKQDNSQQSQVDGPSEITENGPSPESDDRPEFTFVQEDIQQDQQQTQQNQQAQQSTQPQSQPTQQPTQQQDQGPSEIKENDPSPADSDRPEFTFVQEDSAQDQQQNQQQSQQDQQQTQQGQTQNQQNQQQQEQNPSEIKETDPNRESDDRPEFTFVEDNQSGQQGQEQSQQQASQTQQPQQSPSQPQQEQNPTEIKETDPNRLSDDFPEFTFLEGQFINKMKRWFDYYSKVYRV
ncbi:uncharacterized protein LTHEOB_5910 [Lasiodiplodia theobromae]|uniref:uncharacterized protein n=1 Tax=Lasiodiplodia theobromae TaxID=45133 RepID=UPI0015C2F320|nr:uncharacterized protein LTHEOB_5910 [Lasiodiplodia theobromae]KAF4544901.1 hypothetical protein LTHEOB_5910 [Lasiodiplodia theobromae]